MQDKYLNQIHDLYEDFNVVVMPMRDEEIRGPALLKDFAQYLIKPYEPPSTVEGTPASPAVVKKLLELYPALKAEDVYAKLEGAGLPVPK